MNRRMNGLKRINRALDILFLASLSAYLLYEMLGSSTLGFPFPRLYTKGLACGMGLIVGLKCLTDWKWDRNFLFSIVLFLVYAIVYYKSRFMFLLFSGIIIVGCLNIDYRKLLRLYSILSVLFLLSVFLCALGGAIENYIYIRDGFIRSSWGICYPTDMASYMFFMIIISWTAWKIIPNGAALLLGLFSLWFSKYIAMSVTSTACSAFFIIVTVLFIIIEDHSFLSDRLVQKFRSGFGRCAVLSFPLLAILMFVMVYAYSKGFSIAVVANGLLSKRLELAAKAYSEYGLRVFGTPFEQVGNGFSTFANLDYFFVDSSYPLILIRYGWLLFCLICFAWCQTVRKAVRCNDWRCVAAMLLIALHAFSEHHFIEPHFNLLVVMPFASYERAAVSNVETEDLQKQKHLLSDAYLLRLIFVGIVLVVSFLLLPMFLSWMRTLVFLLGWRGGGKKSVRTLTALLLFLGFILVFYVSFYCLLFRKNSGGKTSKRYIIPLLISVVFLGVTVWLGNKLINIGAKRYEKVLKQEEKVITDILSTAEGKVYSDILPEIYRRRFGGFSSSVFSGEELARLYNCSVLMNINQDAHCLTDSGFLFCPVSSRHSLYTNDKAMIKGLSEKGYHLTGFYNVEKEVNLKELARQNGLDYQKKKGLQLSGKEHSLNNGPGLSLFSGQYTVAYELSIDKDAAVEEDYIGTLQVSAYYKRQLLKEYKLYYSQFNEEGRRTVEIPFSTGDYYGVEFLALLESDKRLNVESIRFWRSPVYDIHSYFDRKRRKYREEYYTLDGEPTVRTEGFAACEYEYNNNRIVSEVRYYDKDNQPVLINGGFARIKRKLDNRNRVIRDEYYGTDGKPILKSGGYAANENEYDQNGNIAVQRFYGVDGRMVITASNYAEVHRVFNDKKWIIRESYFDTNGQALNMPQGYAICELEYDVNGNPVIRKYCDSDGKPVMTTWGYAEIRREYNERSQPVLEFYFDENGDPVSRPQNYAGIERQYNSKGQISAERYLDTQGKPVLTTGHYAEVHWEYDERGHISRETYYDQEGLPLEMPQGYEASEREYNDKDQIVLVRYCNAEGTPVLTTWGYAEVHREYDSRSRVIKESYYDTKGQPVLLPEGYQITECEYNEKNQAIVQRYLDTDGNPVITSWGYSEVHREFNEKSQIVKEIYYDVEGKPMTLSNGYAMTEVDRDGAGHAVAQRFYDASAAPTTAFWGYYEVRRTYDNDGNLIKEEYYDSEGKQLK